MLRLTPVLALLPWLGAQTFVVDAANGPGTHYTSIDAATVAVPDGATLLVRPGTYGPFRIQRKALTVLGGPGVDVAQPTTLPAAVEIQNTGVSQTVVVRGLRLVTCLGQVSVLYCGGRVLLEDITYAGQCIPGQQPARSYLIHQSGPVQLHRCSGSMDLAGSQVVLEGCTLHGRDAAIALGLVLGAERAVTVYGGSLQVAGCTLVGGNGTALGPAPIGSQPALWLSGADVRLLAPGTIQAGADPASTAAEAIAGTGNLRLDPGVQLTSTLPPVGVGIAVQVVAMPTVLGSSAAPGGTLQAVVPGPTGAPSMLLAGWPAYPYALPGFTDPIGIDPVSARVTAVGTPPLTATLPVPNLPSLLGVQLAWQAVAATPAGAQASNPSLVLVR